jgi:H+-translocating NAD(P) transhydrogenase subunit alpha
MRISIPKEIYPGERRVAITPSRVEKFKQLGHEVLIEKGAGELAHYSDEDYAAAGASLVSAQAVFEQGQVILKVRPPMFNQTQDQHEVQMMNKGTVLFCFLWPTQNTDLVEQLVQQGVSALAIDKVPRITRAQKMDALSSMANIAGYRAVVEASYHFGRFFTGQMTAAGKINPAKVLVIGAGVAGLSATGAAKGMGAIVRAFDTRPVVKDQVQSLGAEFLEVIMAEDGTGEGGYAKVMSPEFIEKEMALFMAQAKEVDIIITTALIPGKKAPRLITKEMVEQMKPGSVIVDLAAEQGGNCEVTQPNKKIQHHQVTVLGYTDLPSRMANQASQLYASNLFHFVQHLQKDGQFVLDQEDEIVHGSLVCHDGKLLWPPKPLKKATPPPVPPVKKTVACEEKTPSVKVASKKSPSFVRWGLLVLVLACIVWVGRVFPATFLSHLSVFVLACIIGWQVVWNVTPALHTPLMSVTNAISGIILLGGLLGISAGFNVISILAALALLIATINVVGGFLVTYRMLKMFRR